MPILTLPLLPSGAQSLLQAIGAPLDLPGMLQHLRFLEAGQTRALAYPTSYHLGWVALSLVVSIMAAYSMLRIVGRCRSALSPRSRLAWLMLGAIFVGIGIWTTHFSGMAAFSLPVTITYSARLTLLSIVPAIFSGAIMLWLMSRTRLARWQLLAGGALAGTTLGLMHYTGMAAMQMSAAMVYDPWLFGFSGLVAIVLATVAILTQFQRNPAPRARPRFLVRQEGTTCENARVGAALLIGLAIAGVHYVGMTAVLYFPAPGTPSLDTTIDPSWQNMLILLATILIAVVTGIVTLVDRLLEVAARHSTRLEYLVAEHQEARQTLAATQARLQHLLQSSAAVLYSARIEDGFPVTFVSQSVQAVMGYTPEQLFEPNFFWDRVHPDDREATASEMRTVLDKGSASLIYRIRVASGEYRWVHDRTTAVYDQEGKVVEVIGAAIDITSQKELEADLAQARDQALEASRLKSQFLANMSHEIRTPLNAIVGMTSLLLTTPLDARQAEYADTVRASSDALLSVINGILDFSKIEASKLDLEHQPFSLHHCIEQAFELNAIQAAQKQLELAYLVEPSVPLKLIGDVTRVRQILVNLLSNAIKFTDEGEVSVTVTATPLEKPPLTLLSPAEHSQDPTERTAWYPGIDAAVNADLGSRATADPWYEVRFAVRDTGVGIPTDQIEALFDAFSQVDTSTTRKYGGTGLGLAISRQLCKLMGGVMWAESSGQPGAGAVFYFTILVQGAPDQPALAAAPHLAALAGKRLLIIEDNQTSREILLHYARQWRMTATVCDDGASALALLRKDRHFDLALVDLRLPGMTGIEVARAIHSRPATCELPLVMLTAQNFQNRALAEQATEFVAVLSKPVRPQQLSNVLSGLFAKVDPTNKDQPAPVHNIQFDERFPLRILLVEDNRVNQKVACNMLSRLGYRAQVASNGLEALAALEEQNYDLVLMDVQMPEMDGLEATRIIRNQERLAKQPYIIAMTAHALAGDLETCISAGMNDYMTKPVQLDTLAHALARAGAAISPAPAD